MTDKKNIKSKIEKRRKDILGILRKENADIHHYSGPPARAKPDIPYARFFDHTLLKPEATYEQYVMLCEEAKRLGTTSVCVPPNQVRSAGVLLRGSDIKVCTVIGFPLGYCTTATKVAETRELYKLGCAEFDMVLSIGLVRQDDVYAVFRDIEAVVSAAAGRMVKVILETALLTQQEIITAGLAAVLAGAGMLKTSTGFASEGATVENVQLLRMIAGNEIGVKAAGGIRTPQIVHDCIAAGADRIGASSTVSLVEAEKTK